jgi:hypothetical protein
MVSVSQKSENHPSECAPPQIIDRSVRYKCQIPYDGTVLVMELPNLPSLM